MTMKKGMDRREFLKLEAAAMAAAAGGLPAPAAAQNLITDRSFTELKWNKAPCRFCGTGCGVMLGTLGNSGERSEPVTARARILPP